MKQYIPGHEASFLFEVLATRIWLTEYLGVVSDFFAPKDFCCSEDRKNKEWGDAIDLLMSAPGRARESEVDHYWTLKCQPVECPDQLENLKRNFVCLRFPLIPKLGSLLYGLKTVCQSGELGRYELAETDAKRIAEFLHRARWPDEEIDELKQSYISSELWCHALLERENSQPRDYFKRLRHLSIAKGICELSIDGPVVELRTAFTPEFLEQMTLSEISTK